MKPNKAKRVAIVYHYVAHYRRAIFEELCTSESPCYYVLADEVSNIPSIKVLSRSDSSPEDTISRKWIRLRNSWLTKNILWQKGLLSNVLFGRFDIFIMLGNVYFLSTWVAAVMARLMGKDVYFWTHGFRSEEKDIRGFVRLMFYRLADGLLLYGNHSKEILLKKGYKEQRLHVIYNSMDFEHQCEVMKSIHHADLEKKRAELGFQVHHKIIIATGRLTKDKKLDLLIDALAKLDSEEDEYRLVLVGDGPEKHTLAAKANELGVQHKIVMYGECYDEKELAVLISMSSVCVIPGDIGLTAIHSLTYGTPVITHDNFHTHKPEFEAITPGISGDFFCEGSIQSLVEKIRQWTVSDRRDSSEACQSVIRSYYNPVTQASIIRSVLEAD